MKIKELCASERPREKMLSRGAESLSNGELLAVILRSGSSRMSALETAQKLLAECDGSLSTLFNISLVRLSSFMGIGPAKACGIGAALELGRRFMEERGSGDKLPLCSPRISYERIIPEMKGLRHEEFWVMLVNRQKRLLRKERISTGSDCATIVDPKKIMRLALENNAGGMILAHNHPGGNPTPSPADLQQTLLIQEAACTFHIDVLDYIVVCDDCFYSIADEKMYHG